MPIDVQPFLQWAAPILSTVIVTATTASINAKIAAGERKRDEAKAERDAERKERSEWRTRMEQRLDEQEETIRAILSAQCTQMRSDITHKIHRYVDDLGCASGEEKQSLYAEYEEYCNICTKYGITNHFVDQMMKQVMSLPDRHGDF